MRQSLFIYETTQGVHCRLKCAVSGLIHVMLSSTEFFRLSMFSLKLRYVTSWCHSYWRAGQLSTSGVPR